MKNYFAEIQSKLNKELELEDIEIVDNSHKHKGHKFYSEEKYHLKLKIKSAYLNSITRISAHKLIMRILKEDLQNKIHALEITIET